MRVNIYQLNNDERKIKFEDYKTTLNKGGVKASEYKCVFQGDVDAMKLDDVFFAFNTFAKPYLGTFQGHSLSTSDIVEVIGDIPEVYGKIDYLYLSPKKQTKVGETRYFSTFTDYHREVEDCIECGRPYDAKDLSNQHITLTEKGCFFCDSVGWEKVDFDTSECEQMDGLRVLMILPHKAPVETRIIDDLEHWQKAVSKMGEESLMEVTYPLDDNAVIVSNEEAKLNGMDGNRHIGSSIYAGPMYIVNDDNKGGFCDLTDQQIEKYTKMFEQPEDITPEEVQEDCGFTITPWVW